jgi:glycosyltransferase involved in cell wall biosynthesis
MTIGYDAKRAFFNNTGLGNYSRTLLHTLARFAPDNAYVLFSPKPSNNPRLGGLAKMPNVKTVTPQGFPFKQLPALWRSWGLCNDLKTNNIQIYHGLSHELPLGIERRRGIATVVTIHDLIFERYPSMYPFFDRQVYRAKFRSAAQRADRVVAISEQTKQDLIDFYNIKENKIQVIYQSCDPIFYKKINKESIQSILSRNGLPSEYLLYVGSLIERKNLLTLAKAMQLLRGRLPLPLVVIGDGKAYKEVVQRYIKAQHLEKNIIFTRKIDFQDFPAIYQHARALVHPSVFEGFGLPILEALHSSTPVIASEGSCFPEAGGEGALYIDPNDPAMLADAIEKVATDEPLRQLLIEKGEVHAQNFLPQRLASQWLQLYGELV